MVRLFANKDRRKGKTPYSPVFLLMNDYGKQMVNIDAAGMFQYNIMQVSY
jgi:hypothetical protein